MDSSNALDVRFGQSDGEYCGSDNCKFEPSFRVLHRALSIILSENGKTRTALAQQANLNYCRLSSHIEWLRRKNLVRLIVEEGKVKIILTESGVMFAVTLVGRQD
jgi:predicted transcriptional regulator